MDAQSVLDEANKEANEAIQRVLCPLLGIEPAQLPAVMPRIGMGKLPGGALAIYLDKNFAEPLCLLLPGAYGRRPDNTWGYLHQVLTGEAARKEISRRVYASVLTRKDWDELPPDHPDHELDFTS